MPRIPFKDQFKVAPSKCGTGFLVVDAKGIPCGPMRDFYSEEEKISVQAARNTYPMEFRGERQKPMTERLAKDCLERLKLHIQSVIDHVRPTMRVGSSAYWDKDIFVD